jgi:hypothetical protein
MMNKNLNYSDYVNAYLDGNFTSAEKAEFLEKLKMDPLLESEYHFQKDIVDALKEYRKTELKNRLNAISVGGAVSYTSFNYGAMKIAASVILASMASIGIYWYMNDEKPPHEDFLVVNSPLLLSEPNNSFDLLKPEESFNEAEMVSGLEEAVAVEEMEAVEETSGAAGVVTAGSSMSSGKAETKSVDFNYTAKPKHTPVVVQPDVISEFDDVELSQQSRTSNVHSDIFVASENKFSDVEVETKTSNRYNFHYQFQDNKLFLFGDFTDMPYEIIDLKSSANNSLYLFYRQTYYSLKPTKSRIIPLEPIKSPKLIKELNIVKDHKGY